MKAIKITTNNRISVIDIDVNDFRAINREIGCSFHEVVKTKTMMDWFTVPVVMLVDEEGLLRHRHFNSVASYMYGVQFHGQPIVGDVIFCQPDGEYLAGFGNAEVVKRMLMIGFPYLEEEQDE